MAVPPRTPRDAEAFPDGICRLIIIGKTGNGKSATGNTILGRKFFESQSGINSSTKVGKFCSAKRFNLDIQVMDTPGLADTQDEDTLMSLEIIRSLCAMHPGPHAVLLVLRCDARFVPEEFKVYQALKNIFGEDLAKFMIVIFVGKDDLDKGGKKFKDQLHNCSPNLLKVLEEAGNRYVLFDNMTEDQEVLDGQVRQLICFVKHIALQNGGKCFQHQLSENVDTTMNALMKEETLRRSSDDPITMEERRSSDDPITMEERRSSDDPITMERQQMTREQTTSDQDTQLVLKEITDRKEELKRLENKAKVQQLADKFEKNLEVEPSLPAKFRLAARPEEFPEKCEMEFGQKQWMVYNAISLKQKIVNTPETLTDVQKEVLITAAKPIKQRFKEAMNKYVVERLDACSIM